MANKMTARGPNRHIITCGKIDQTQTKDSGKLWPFKDANGGTVTANTITETSYQSFKYNKNTDELACETFFEVGGFGTDALSISTYTPSFSDYTLNSSEISIRANYTRYFIDEDGHWIPPGSFLPVMYRYRYGDNDAKYLAHSANPRITIGLGKTGYVSNYDDAPMMFGVRNDGWVANILDAGLGLDDNTKYSHRQSSWYEYFYAGAACIPLSGDSDPSEGMRLPHFEDYIWIKTHMQTNNYDNSFYQLRQENIGLIYLYDIYYKEGMYFYKKSLPSTQNIRIRYHSNGTFADIAMVTTYAKTTFI